VPAIHAVSHVDHEKMHVVAWLSISMHAYTSFPIIVVFCLLALLATGAPLKISQFMYHAETKSSKRSKSKSEEKAQVLLVPRVVLLSYLNIHFS